MTILGFFHSPSIPDNMQAMICPVILTAGGSGDSTSLRKTGKKGSGKDGRNLDQTGAFGLREYFLRI